MAMVDVVFQLPRGGSMAQARQLGPNIGSHLVLFGIRRVNQVNSCNDSES